MMPATRAFTPGQILGDRYRMVGMLGRGGMGEVWRAYDLKLQVDVALKSVRPELFLGEEALELLRREVRSAREVMSPNVCRIFDLVEEEGQEFVSMEYVDGETMLELLQNRAPLELQEATRIASQFLAGLEAIHQAGLVHRDVKPENIMVTRTGRVVLMDFGVAKGMEEDHRGTISGTPAYIAPEQYRSEALDARADIFAAGVVLTEIIAPTGLREHSSRQSIWNSVRKQPLQLFESPWRRVLECALAEDRASRYGSARELARALEEVTLRVEGAEEKHPYPGLHSFTEADAEFFFGREQEVEVVWKKLQRASLLGIIGPSGAGKTSFLQAGLLPAKPAGWHHVLLRPGATPFATLAQQLVGELADDTEAMRQLVEIERPEQALAVVTRWRARHEQVLVVVDQFEELFTLCRPEVQAGFADLLGRLAIEADVHVLLSMRDDFLFQCQVHPLLRPVFSDLTPLAPPTGSALRRALVQPALLCGYRFEDESLADEMLGSLHGERGALLMLGFAAARLWERRDRERGLLTREAYERIGGVSGALAQHAEATLGRIGTDREALVREMFRNLVTARGTRAVMEVEGLLSVFKPRAAAESVFRELVDARLLTTFEIEEEQGKPRRQVEIVHEALLTQWPRLVRWQTQDADMAQFRDQLRQQAVLWLKRGRPDDLLWTGNTYREFALWSERYPGGLMAVEEAYVRSMKAHAEQRRRRRHRILMATVVGLSATVALLAAFGVRAYREQRHSLSHQYLAFGLEEVETNPTRALAYAIASLEAWDNPEVRRFAVRVLHTGPIGFAVDPAAFPEVRGDSLSMGRGSRFTPDGRWLMIRDGQTERVQIWSQEGGPPRVTRSECYANVYPGTPGLLASLNAKNYSLRIFTIPDGNLVRTSVLPPFEIFQYSGSQLWTHKLLREERSHVRWVTCAYSITTGEVTTREEVWPAAQGYHYWGGWLGMRRSDSLFVTPYDRAGTATPTFVGVHPGMSGAFFGGGRIASTGGGVTRIWSMTPLLPEPLWTIHNALGAQGLDEAGHFFVNGGFFDLRTNPGVHPLFFELDSPLSEVEAYISTTPDGAWAVRGPSLFPLIQPAPRKLYDHPGTRAVIAGMTADGDWVVSNDLQTVRRSGSLRHAARDSSRILVDKSFGAMSANGQWVLATSKGDGYDGFIVPTDGSEPRRAGPISWPGGRSDFAGGPSMFRSPSAISDDGRYVASVTSERTNHADLRVMDVATGAVHLLIPNGQPIPQQLCFVSPDRLLSVGQNGVYIWNLQDGTGRLLRSGKAWIPCAGQVRSVGPDRCLIAMTEMTERPDQMDVGFLDCGDGGWEHLVYAPKSYCFSPDGTRYSYIDKAASVLWVGRVRRAGRAAQLDEPAIVCKLQGLSSYAISTDGTRAAVGCEDGSVCLVSVPSGRPLHVLPRRELLGRLRQLTNVRVVQDPSVPAGHHLIAERFPGWKRIPVW